MTPSNPVDMRRLGPADLALMDELLSMFGEAFEDMASYRGSRAQAPPTCESCSATRALSLSSPSRAKAVVGGLAAYELQKFEQERSEIYIYDLAVAADHRREGVATALIETLKVIAAARGAYVIYVQADLGDEPAIALYSKLGVREDVLHFDIAVDVRGAED
jgi:aminoglycoside 3-N-acetyltransferase I